LAQAVDIIGVPIDLGAGQRGVRLGPQALRAAGLRDGLEALGYAVSDRGDVEVLSAEEAGPADEDRPHNIVAIRQACGLTASLVESSMRAGAFPLVIGGDHSLAIGVLAGIARAKGAPGVIWIDAHADINTPQTSPSGNVHGMPMAVALGESTDVFPPADFGSVTVDAERCVFVGLRDVDSGERRILKERGLTCFTMSDIDRLGMASVIRSAIEIAGGGPASVHLSLDIDSLDPRTAPGTGTPVPGGLTYREAHLAMELLSESGIVHSLEMVEVNPLLDPCGTTARVAVELICSAMGKTIL